MILRTHMQMSRNRRRLTSDLNTCQHVASLYYDLSVMLILEMPFPKPLGIRNVHVVRCTTVFGRCIGPDFIRLQGDDAIVNIETQRLYLANIIEAFTITKASRHARCRHLSREKLNYMNIFNRTNRKKLQIINIQPTGSIRT